MLIYGMILNSGKGVPVNKREAAKYLKLSSDKGNPDGMFYYARYAKKKRKTSANMFVI